MADRRPLQEYFKTVSALGRNVEVGDFYDYVTDEIINGKGLKWFNFSLVSVLLV